MATPQYSGMPQQNLDFSVIGEAFTVLTKHWQKYIIPGAIIMAANIPLFIVAQWPNVSRLMGQEPSAGAQLASIGIQIPLAFLTMIACVLLLPGISQYTINVVRGTESMDDLWVGFRDPLGMFAVMFLAGLVAALGILGCCIGFFFTGGLMMFALPHKLVTGETASQSVSRSWEMLKSQVLVAAAIFFVTYILGTLGELACYVGWAFTMPLTYIVPALLYCRYNGIGRMVQQSPHSPYPRGEGSGQNMGGQPPQSPPPPSQPPGPGDMGG